MIAEPGPSDESVAKRVVVVVVVVQVYGRMRTSCLGREDGKRLMCPVAHVMTI